MWRQVDACGYPNYCAKWWRWGHSELKVSVQQWEPEYKGVYAGTTRVSIWIGDLFDAYATKHHELNAMCPSTVPVWVFLDWCCEHPEHHGNGIEDGLKFLATVTELTGKVQR